MKATLLFLFLLCMGKCSVYGQYYDDVLSYNINDYTANGVKIKTNLPFVNATAMPTLLVEGYDYQNGNPINLTLTWYVNSGNFIHTFVSSAGAITPPISLANENGKISIFIDYKGYYTRLHIRAFAKGLSADVAANYTGWTAVDSLLISTASPIANVSYKNVFAGNVYLPDSITSTSTGKFGIGTLTPKASLDIAGTFNDTLTSVLARLTNGNASGTGTFLGTRSYSSSNNNAPMFGIVAAIGGKENSKIVFNKGATFTGGFLTFHTNDGSEKMRLDSNGNLGIGTTNPGTFKLAVEGTIGARKLKCQTASWADFVFQPEYKLPSLADVEQYVLNNHHLEGIPKESEVLKEGVDVGEMNKLLLQKVEELTLYLIELNKKNVSLEEDNAQMKDSMKEIKAMLVSLKEKMSL